ncbi:hypothetical protein IS481_04095 [Caldimonas thermodepolymerans]|uniref:Uncharacterized protein n=1 Tax=Caldimonas thermodepolymerans TaxID=215580 RepID=A0A2S5T863_9BURK|nr:hypothetical protein [Caldimonas thermodepolymerans]PPE71190.1 hypothetical protein C1702_01845 [Caldimonas thermodepolymerans]QPC32363.1 hypothetical protein IS481_04095 [Caldimonas thermodepolymerans]RDH98744.1 hypothetical protein DES46_10615 [Caldimonas thermodepolymerans]
MSKDATQPAKQPNVTERLWSLFDQVGVEALPLNFAQALAEAEGLNRTSAGIAFYRWRAARLPSQEQHAA